MTNKQLDKEIEQNYSFFQKQKIQLQHQHKGGYVLIRHQNIIDVFDNFGDAMSKGEEQYKDGLFSVQEIQDIPVTLGFYGVR